VRSMPVKDITQLPLCGSKQLVNYKRTWALDGTSSDRGNAEERC